MITILFDIYLFCNFLVFLVLVFFGFLYVILPPCALLGFDLYPLKWFIKALLISCKCSSLTLTCFLICSLIKSFCFCMNGLFVFVNLSADSFRKVCAKKPSPCSLRKLLLKSSSVFLVFSRLFFSSSVSFVVFVLYRCSISLEFMVSIGVVDMLLLLLSCS